MKLPLEADVPSSRLPFEMLVLNLDSTSSVLTPAVCHLIVTPSA